MNEKQVQEWLSKEAKSGNTLAESYLALLATAPQQMRSYWFDQLGTMLSTAEKIVEKIKEEELGER